MTYHSFLSNLIFLVAVIAFRNRKSKGQCSLTSSSTCTQGKLMTSLRFLDRKMEFACLEHNLFSSYFINLPIPTARYFCTSLSFKAEQAILLALSVALATFTYQLLTSRSILFI